MTYVPTRSREDRGKVLKAVKVPNRRDASGSQPDRTHVTGDAS